MSLGGTELTVVAALITRRFTVHASDSLLTVARSDGCLDVAETRLSKIVRVPAFRGIVSYWGFAGDRAKWRTFRWLTEQSGQAGTHKTPERFAGHLASGLQSELNSRQFCQPTDAGIGIHFTAYERVDGHWIPELFLISNWVIPRTRVFGPLASASLERHTGL